MQKLGNIYRKIPLILFMSLLEHYELTLRSKGNNYFNRVSRANARRVPAAECRRKAADRPGREICGRGSQEGAAALVLKTA